MRKGQVPAPNPHAVVRGRVRQATLADLDLLVRHRRGMWNAIAKIAKADLDAADRIYRRWARIQMKSNRFAGFIVEVGGEPVASGASGSCTSSQGRTGKGRPRRIFSRCSRSRLIAAEVTERASFARRSGMRRLGRST